MGNYSPPYCEVVSDEESESLNSQGAWRIGDFNASGSDYEPLLRTADEPDAEEMSQDEQLVVERERRRYLHFTQETSQHKEEFLQGVADEMDNSAAAPRTQRYPDRLARIGRTVGQYLPSQSDVIKGVGAVAAETLWKRRQT